MILKGLNSQTTEELRSYLCFLFDFVSIEDDFSIQRWEWMLGYPQLVIKNDRIELDDISD
jgi:hypothetical protein